jgi:glycine/D-amino acid oxidase-like deaminating enzyme
MADVAILGGGVAGLWLLNVLVARGYDAVLCERSALGDGQTIVSQGMIHGGLKYALGGRLTAAADAIAGMPARWRRCLAGDLRCPGDVDLRGVPVLSDHYHLWADTSALGRLGGFLASKALRARVERLAPSDFPAALGADRFTGAVYRTWDLVLDVPALLARLAEPHRDRILRGEPVPSMNGATPVVRIGDRALAARTLVCAAGAGNEALLARWPFDAPPMQRRPLQQVLVRDFEGPALYAHWIADVRRGEPRITVTSHRQGDGRWCWYLGGQLASDGAARTADAQIAVARAELSRAVPWLDFGGARFDTLLIDRAEPRQRTGTRPDHAYVGRTGPALVCWPTKLSLVPDLADRVLAALPPPAGGPGMRFDGDGVAGVVTVPVARPPWER